MPIKSKTLFKETRRVFTFSEMHAIVARLAVLYEDLKIETAGITAKSLRKLDYTNKQYRVNYFLRRTIATLIEVAEALRMLENDVQDFQLIKATFGQQQLSQWEKRNCFFQTK